jgi:hypothetical protein
VEHESEKAPGLKRRRGGKTTYWVASIDGYIPRTVNLTGWPPETLAQRCRQLQAGMLAWADQGADRRSVYIGTLGSALALYTTDPESKYQRLKPSSRHPYDIYLAKLAKEYGDRRVDALTGRDIKVWFRTWREPAALGSAPQLARAAMVLCVLKAALSHGALCGHKDCAGLIAMIREGDFAQPQPRDLAPTVEIVEKARGAAHDLGHARAALAFALQFETTARQWDVIGEWIPLDDPRPSALIRGARKWIGPTWSAIGADNVFRLRPTKTERTTGAMMAVDLSLCPMVAAELAKIPRDERTGPLIVDPATGLPYEHRRFQRLWKAIREKVDLDPKLWNRDLRAGGITEAQSAGARAEDRAKMSAHSRKTNEVVYSREVEIATKRVLRRRLAHRENSRGNVSGNTGNDQ